MRLVRHIIAANLQERLVDDIIFACCGRAICRRASLRLIGLAGLLFKSEAAQTYGLHMMAHVILIFVFPEDFRKIIFL